MILLKSLLNEIGIYANDARFGLGVIAASGAVDFKEFPRDEFSSQIHGRYGNPGGFHTFRYAGGIIDWSNGQPKKEIKDIATEYFKKAGWPVKKHTSYYDALGPPDDFVDESIYE
jgi:hypothetical protein